MYENRALRKAFGPKRDEVTVEWRRLHNEEHYAVYSSLYIIREIKSRRMRSVGHVGRDWERRGACRDLVGKHKEKRSLGRPRRRWENNITNKSSRSGKGRYGLDRSGSG